MKMHCTLTALAMTAVTMAAPGIAANPAPAKTVCLQRHDIDGWGARDDHSIVVNDRFGKKYLLSLAGLCRDFDFSLGVTFPSRTGNGMTCLERGDRVAAHMLGEPPHGPASCWIAKIEAYTPEMEKAYREAKAHTRDADGEKTVDPVPRK